MDRNAKFVGEQIAKSGKLTQNAVIVLSGCNAGNWAKGQYGLGQRTWLQKLANASRHVVIAAGGDKIGTVLQGDVQVDNSGIPGTEEWYAGQNIWYVFYPQPQ